MDWQIIKKNKEKIDKDKEKYDKESRLREEISVKCKFCGHKNIIPVYVDKKCCTWCGRAVSNNTKAHFIYKTKNMLKKQENLDDN